ncbi:transcription elongation factor GreA [Patescibacteria group bacterium]
MTKVLTPQGYKKLEDELEQLKKERLPEIAEKIKQAKELGDLSENAEYHAAKEEQAIVNGRIAEISQLLKGGKIVDPAQKKAGVVSIGSLVRVKKDGEEMTFTLVGSNESDPMQGKVSNESPIGSALLGKKNGEVAEVNLPDGVAEYEIIGIE